MRTIAPCLIAFVAVACATFSLDTGHRSIQQMVGSGTCTAWALSPNRWVTAKHCIEMSREWMIGGAPATVIALDPLHDIAIITGPHGTAYLQVADEPPPLGAVVDSLGYGLGQGQTLLSLPGVVLAQASSFFGEDHGDFLIGGTNGMPGMSGGPILYRGKVVSMMTGGGPAPTPAHQIGSGVPWAALSAFTRLHRGR